MEELLEGVEAAVAHRESREPEPVEEEEEQSQQRVSTPPVSPNSPVDVRRVPEQVGVGLSLDGRRLLQWVRTFVRVCRAQVPVRSVTVREVGRYGWVGCVVQDGVFGVLVSTPGRVWGVGWGIGRRTIGGAQMRSSVRSAATGGSTRRRRKGSFQEEGGGEWVGRVDVRGTPREP